MAVFRRSIMARLVQSITEREAEFQNFLNLRRASTPLRSYLTDADKLPDFGSVKQLYGQQLDRMTISVDRAQRKRRGDGDQDEQGDGFDPHAVLFAFTVDRWDRRNRPHFKLTLHLSG